MSGQPVHDCSLDTHPAIPDPAGGWRLPAPGERVLYRSECLQPPEPAVVTVVEIDLSDPNVWGEECVAETVPGHQCAPGCPVRPVPLPSPNPNVQVRTDSGFCVVTRQIRRTGSPGWAWPDHPA
ncbi:hypothetical protein Aph01nite_74100 [Acrocarpospora phusangensis]|uniref:Uncharacterized protein n=1 Tax=Acrocarpospora phusangensis TaxID=1070424 RepID=A0A919QKF8_9ACTN|nr:hypothetical protein [Acrocarpospora phusangensis]GIH29100.1 hypothetical protein Aph01nite_74100 [Acrocarpospora phusangensis]